MNFHFINVGKGSSTIIDFPSNRLSVIDVDDSRSISEEEKLIMGTQKKALPNNPIDYILNNFGDREIFRFILTHPDMDHMSGIKTLFSNKTIRHFWDVPNNKPNPGNWSEQTLYDENDWNFYERLRDGSVPNTKTINPLRGDEEDCCWVQDKMTILSPDPELIKKAEESGDYDHLSYVFSIYWNGKRTIIAGDPTKIALDDIVANHGINALEASVLLAPGHGSKNHISKDFLDAVKPRLTVVSVAEGVEYDSDSYKNYGKVLSTKHYGNVKVRIKDNKEIIFTTQFQNYSDGWYKLKQRSYYYGE